MDIAQVSTQFFSAAMPAACVSAGVVGFLLVVSGCALRWQKLVGIIRRNLLNRSQYNYPSIFQDYLERFNSITDRRDLYPAILTAACGIVGSSGASLIVRDAKDEFQIKSSSGLKPFSFEVSEVRPFLKWLEKHREVVTRADLVHSKKCVQIKSEGLRYFVQFNAEACVPLFVGDKLYGVVNLGERAKHIYDAETRELLKLMSIQFATAIHNVNLYQALIRQNLSLQEASRFKTQMMSNLSHELRTPLSQIIGLSELMVEDAGEKLSDEQKDHLKIIRQSGERLLDAVTSIMDISKLEVNRLGLDVQKVNIGKVTQQVAHEIPFNNYTKLENNLNEETPGVYGDEKRVRQVMKNLLDNAAKFTPKGKVTIDAEKCGEMLRIRIKDTGPGIAKEKQKIIFDGFTQADGSVTRSHEGLGLGLAISKKLVELHGGRMWLTSKEGKGSEFCFTLPLKPVSVFDHNGFTRN